jgi:hypothetical protein
MLMIASNRTLRRTSKFALLSLWCTNEDGCLQNINPMGKKFLQVRQCISRGGVVFGAENSTVGPQLLVGLL